MRTDLDRTLREADRGWAESSGATWDPGRGWTVATFGIGVIDSLDAGIALIRQVLRRHRADPGTRLIRNRRPIPLRGDSLDTFPRGT